MNKTELTSIFEQGEGYNIEFKESFSSRIQGIRVLGKEENGKYSDLDFSP